MPAKKSLDKREHVSLHLRGQLNDCLLEKHENFRLLRRDSNPCPPPVQCSTNRALKSLSWVHSFAPVKASMNEMNVYSSHLIRSHNLIMDYRGVYKKQLLKSVAHNWERTTALYSCRDVFVFKGRDVFWIEFPGLGPGVHVLYTSYGQMSGFSLTSRQETQNKRRRNTFPPCYEITDHRRGKSWRNQTRHRRPIIQRLSFISKVIQQTTIQEQVDFYTLENLSACFSQGKTLRTLRKTTLFYRLLMVLHWRNGKIVRNKKKRNQYRLHTRLHTKGTGIANHAWT